MRAFVFAAALAAVSSSVLYGQAAQQAKPSQAEAAKPVALPEARAIIDRHIEASGGRAAILAHTSVHTAGTFSVPAQGINGTFDAYGAKPNRSLLKISIPGLGDMVDGFDGTNGWTNSPMTGPMILQGKQLEQKRFDSDLYGDLHDPARFESIKTVEKTTFDGRPCYKLSLVRKGGEEDFEFYDVATGLLAGSINTRETPMGSLTSTTTRGEYQKFGDLLQPASIKVAAMGMEQVLTFTSVEYDKVDPAVFEMPAEIKALIK